MSSCLANAEEWQDIKRFLIQFLQGDFEDSCSNDEFRDLAKALFAQAFQGIPPKQVSMDSVEDVDFHQRHLSVRSIGPSQDFGNMSEARAFLAERVHLASAEDKATALLTSIVRVSGRFPHLPRDAVLVDLPELEDTHVLRSSSAERYLSMQCTHARYCLPTHEGKLRNNESIHSQIRILAWGGCLEDVVLVRTFGDTKKPQKMLEKDFKDFKDLCTKAQRGFDFAQLPAKWVSVTVAPAENDDEEAEISIDAVTDILQGIASCQKQAAQELAPQDH